MSKEEKDISLRCQLCGGETGTVLKLGDLSTKLPDLKPESDVYLHGICQRCQSDLDEGCVIFVDANNRVMKVSVEGTKSKIAPEFHGKIVKITIGAMTELLTVYMTANGKPPTSPN